MFHENWYSEPQQKILAEKAESVKDLQGLIIEIGCWEGRSTIALANAVCPQMLLAVDTWRGNIDENNDNISVRLAQERNVFKDFYHNIVEFTKGNVIPFRLDCFVFLQALQYQVKFCHIDACHDYDSVKRTLELLLPRLVPGGILCGDDYVTANMWREDLKGGVQKAVIEMCPGHVGEDNFWWYKKNS